jgi:plastocyanin
MGFGVLWLLLLLLVVGGLVAALVASTGSRAGSEPAGPQGILRQRLAAGEIDEDEYRERAGVLRSTHTSRPSAGRWVVIVVLSGAALLLVGLLVTGAGMGAAGWRGPMGDHMGAMMGTRAGPGATPDVIPDAREVSVEAGEMWFQPATVEVAAGEPVNLAVVNRGQLFHDLTIDELGLRIDVDSGQRDTAGLTVEEPGAYEFYCSVPGHASAGMRGTLLVQDSLD